VPLRGRSSFQQSECRSLAGLVATDPRCRIDQLLELRGRVVRHDVAVRVPQQHLSRFERYTGRTQPPAAGVLQVVTRDEHPGRHRPLSGRPRLARRAVPRYFSRAASGSARHTSRAREPEPPTPIADRTPQSRVPVSALKNAPLALVLDITPVSIKHEVLEQPDQFPDRCARNWLPARAPVRTKRSKPDAKSQPDRRSATRLKHTRTRHFQPPGGTPS